MDERILIAEDDPHMLDTWTEVLKQAGYEVMKACSGEGAERMLRTSAVDIVITDVKMPKMGGIDVLKIAKEIDPETAVILITAFPAVEAAVEAMKFGACDYLTKPFSVDQLLATVERSLEARRTKETYGVLGSQARRSLAERGVLGASRAMLSLCTDIRRAASVDANVLILGESGSGKEVVARAIHDVSHRRGNPFLPINCAAIPESLLEAELYGYERGAFTGALVSREGLFEVADGGTIFLDEVCEVSPHLQAKLLRALEEGAVRRLGGRRPVAIEVRFMAATNRDIRKELKEGRFREDLFFRLDVIEIQVPPLRDRRGDIPLLAAHFLEASSAQFGKRLEGITQPALELLTRHAWPGNVRELKNAIERAVAYARGPFITPTDLPAAVAAGGGPEDLVGFHRWREHTIEELERKFLGRALREHGGNITQAARALGVHRSTLQRLIRRHKLSAA
jgi:DNA-binding NtrC family response regulator